MEARNDVFVPNPERPQAGDGGFDGKGLLQPDRVDQREPHQSSPRYASRISGLFRRFWAVSDSTIWPVWST